MKQLSIIAVVIAVLGVFALGAASDSSISTSIAPTSVHTYEVQNVNNSACAAVFTASGVHGFMVTQVFYTGQGTVELYKDTSCTQPVAPAGMNGTSSQNETFSPGIPIPTGTTVYLQDIGNTGGVWVLGYTF